MIPVTIKIWCEMCKMYTEDDMEEHKDRHENERIVRQIKIDYVDCERGTHKLSRHYTGEDMLVIRCKYCNYKSTVFLEPAGDISGASYDEWGGR